MGDSIQIKEWRYFYQRFTDSIFVHQKHKGAVGTLARSLIRQIESLWLFLDIVEIESTILCDNYLVRLTTINLSG